MRARRLSPFLAAALLLGAACGDDRIPLPTQIRPADANFLVGRQLTAYEDAQALLPTLFPSGPLLISAKAQLLGIKVDVDASPPRLERAKVRAWAFIFYTGGLFHAQKLLDPEGAPTTQDNVLKLVCAISIVASLKLETSVCNLNGSSLAGDGKLTFVNSSADDIPDVVATETKSAALKIPAGNGNVLVSITRYLDSHILQKRFKELAPKWRIALSPTPPPLDAATPDDKLFVAGLCVINDPESESRPDELDEPYVHVIHVRSDNGKATAAQRTKVLAENGLCKVGDHVALGTSSRPGTSFASRTLYQVRRLATAVGSFLTPRPAYARGRVYRFDVGGVGGLLFDIHSDFPLGVVYPDLRIQTAPELSSESESVVRGGSVSISGWQIRNIQLRELNPDQPLRPCAEPGEGCVEVRAPGEAPGDVAVHHEEASLPDVRHGYYLSSNQILDEGDIPLTSDEGSPRTPRTELIAGGSANVDGEGRTLTIPDNAPIGPQYILAVIDDDRAVDARGRVPEVQPLEGNGNHNGEADNVVALPITITDPSVVIPLGNAAVVSDCTDPPLGLCGQAFVQGDYRIHSFWFRTAPLASLEGHFHPNVDAGGPFENHHFNVTDGERQGLRIRRTDGQPFTLKSIQYRTRDNGLPPFGTPFEIGTGPVTSVVGSPSVVSGYTQFPAPETATFTTANFTGFAGVTEVWITMRGSADWRNIVVTRP